MLQIEIAVTELYSRFEYSSGAAIFVYIDCCILKFYVVTASKFLLFMACFLLVFTCLSTITLYIIGISDFIIQKLKFYNFFVCLYNNGVRKVNNNIFEEDAF